MIQNSLKTHKEFTSNNKCLNFDIYKIEDVYTVNKELFKYPHRHDYFVIIAIKKGKGLHKVDFNTHDLSPNQIYFIYPGQVHQLINSEDTEGYVLLFRQEFLIENSITIKFLDELNLFNDYGPSEPLELSKKSFDIALGYLHNIYDIYYNEDPKMKFLSIGSLLKLFFIKSYNLCDKSFEEEIDTASDNIMISFKKDISEFMGKEHSIKFYADRLSITPDHLSRVVKSKLGKSAKEYLQYRIVVEAKRLLHFTDMTNKEISYELGFKMPSNFSSFFKNIVGISPSEFKKSSVII